MRIAIDVTSAAKPDPTGIGRYALEMPRALAGLLGPEDRLRVAVRPQRWGERRWVAALGRPRLLLPVLPRLLLGRIDVFHSLGASLPPAVRALRAATIHDTNTLDDESLARRAWVEGRAEKIREVAARADMLIAVSSFVRERLLHHFPELGPERVRVTHHGVDHGGLGSEPQPGDADARARLGLGGRRYVLSVGRVERRKNPEGLVRAFARARAAAGHDLVFAGPRGVSDVDAALREGGAALAERVRFLGRVEDADLGPLYRGAAAFALPSHYEGFGISLAEALACAVPSIATARTSLPEVAGEAALLVEDDVEAIAGGLERVLGDEALRAELRRRGPERARRFTWRACAEQTLAAYRALVALGPRTR